MRLPPARATAVLVGATCLAWAVASLGPWSDTIGVVAGFIPARVGGLALNGAVPVWLTPLSATLVHAGIVHLAFNMLMLGFCGRYVEPSIGWIGVVTLYVGGAYAAAAAQYAVDPSGMVAMVGASGAVSALFAAYALLYGERRGRFREGRLGAALQILWLAAAWIGLQILVGFATVQGGRIATAAHVGGFLFGLLMAKPLLRLHWRKA
ncbi:rhomboid family intramembrane serine protease [Sphingomonas montana]|uniref:rhomboid family intramembrane serine protease n=1 Tax=Sphingomonas montana TaxID=1843236 RepID=UPI0009701668|nr:rhomboid family intramembrane serine protease [Sphingomonas montana]